MRPEKLQQNTICLEQQTYASQENVKQLLVMVETFRRSADKLSIAIFRVNYKFLTTTFAG